ncbi:DUF624 domain-containing protein [Enterococcus sp. LJL98]
MKDNKWSRFFDTVFKILILNFLTFLCSLLGVLVFGFFPSIAALSVTLKKSKESHWKELMVLFWKTYKKYFLKANAKGGLLSGVGFYLLLNTKICFQLTPLIFTVFGIFSFLSFLFCIALMFNYLLLIEEWENSSSLKHLLQYTIYSFPTNLLQMLLVSLFIVLCPLFPAIILFGGVVLINRGCLYLMNRGLLRLQSEEIAHEISNK